MAFFVAQDGLQTPVKHRRRVRILAGLVTLGFVALERRGHLELPEHGRDTAPQATAAFAAAAGVAAASPWIDNSPWPGWAMVGISRLALRVHPAIAGSLALAHAVAVGYADDKRAGLLSRALTDQVATCLIAPAAVMTVVGTRLPLLRRQEIQLQQGLTRVAQLNELAEDFHAQHSVLDPVEELLVLLRVAPFSSGYGLSLQDAREGITKTAELLPPAHTASDFADQFAAAVAARIYPASIAYDRRDDKLAQLDLRAASKPVPASSARCGRCDGSGVRRGNGTGLACSARPRDRSARRHGRSVDGRRDCPGLATVEGRTGI